MIHDLNHSYEILITRLAAWGEREDDVRALAVIGSRARKDHPADVWADLDVLVFARAPEQFWKGADWLRALGEPMVTFVEPTSDRRGFERRVLFASGCDVDFVPIDAAGFGSLLAGGIPEQVADIIGRGIRILLDKDSLLAPLAGAISRPSLQSTPSEAEFVNLVSDFWYHTVWVTKHLRRGELWWAKSGADGYLKGLLLRMLEWHTRAYDPTADTWMNGRFLEEWADARVVAALPAIYARYDQADIWRALLATMDLFRWVSRETATVLHYSYPDAGMNFATNMVRQLAPASAD